LLDLHLGCGIKRAAKSQVAANLLAQCLARSQSCRVDLAVEPEHPGRTSSGRSNRAG
jgi:hypothetical protein